MSEPYCGIIRFGLIGEYDQSIREDERAKTIAELRDGAEERIANAIRDYEAKHQITPTPGRIGILAVSAIFDEEG